MQWFAEFDATLKAATTKAHSIDSLAKNFQPFKDQVGCMLHLLRQQISGLYSTVDSLEISLVWRRA